MSPHSRQKWSAPAGNFPGRGCRGATKTIGKRTCKPNSVVCGHSSRRRVAADVHQRPTRRFRPLHQTPATKTCRREPPHGAALRRRAGTGHRFCSEPVSPSLFGLAPCGVYPAPGVTAGAVRSCRTISPLPRRWSLRNGECTGKPANSGIAFPGRPSGRFLRNGEG